jgi:hypothetical protein
VSRPYEFYPAWDGKHASPIILKVIELAEKRWKAKNLGSYVNRQMRDKPFLSTHATGYAADLGGDIKTLEAMWAWYLKHSAQIGLQELHFYKMPGTKYGAGYRCSRGEGDKGVLRYKTAEESAGTGGLWLHIEISQKTDPAVFETYFRANKD